MGKGDWRRPSQISEEQERANWEAVFGKKKLNVMSDEERAEMEAEKARLAEETDARHQKPQAP